MVVFTEKISRSQAKQSKAKQSGIFKIRKQSKAKLGFQNPEAKQSKAKWNFQNPEAKQSGRQSKVGKVKAKQSGTPDRRFLIGTLPASFKRYVRIGSKTIFCV